MLEIQFLVILTQEVHLGVKTDDLGWVVGSDTLHGTCCPKQKVGEGGILERVPKKA